MNGHSQVSSTQMDIKPDLVQLQQAQDMMNAANAAAVMQAQQQQQQQPPPGYNPYGYGMSPLMASPHSSMGSPSASLGSPGASLSLVLCFANPANQFVTAECTYVYFWLDG